MKIFQIEITNHCQFSCQYCPRTTDMTRLLGIMSEDTIDNVVKYITSSRCRLHHYGESLLYSERTLYAVEQLSNKGIKVELNTNGEYFNNFIAAKLFRAGIDKVTISFHNKLSLHHIDKINPVYRENIEILKIVRPEDRNKYIPTMIELKDKGYIVSLKTLRDLGQVKKNSDISEKKNCSFLDNNEFVVLWNGDIVSCCEVYNADPGEILGNINNGSIPEMNRSIEKCKTCLGYGNDTLETERFYI